jgi:hypothetical protein
MIKILAIGNSFSEDATAYLYDIAQSDNVEIKVVNLYIGGCSLKTHWENVENNAPDYVYQINGRITDRKISILEALKEEEWDFVTIQQASHDSGLLETYYPFVKNLSKYVTQHAPKAEQLFHQTWAYEIDSDHGCFAWYHNDQMEMYQALTKVIDSVAKDLSLRIIPCGKLIQELRTHNLFDYSSGGKSLCRDGFHMHLTYGRYAIAAAWYEFILGKSILENTFVPPAFEEEIVDLECIDIIKKYVHDIINK